MPANAFASPATATSSGSSPTCENSVSVSTTFVPSSDSSMRWMVLFQPAARRSPVSAPPKFDAVYSTSPLVENPKLVSEPSEPRPRASHSTGFDAGTGDCGFEALNVFAALPRVGFACPP